MSRNKYINYINDNINEMNISDRREILQMIINDVNHEKIVEKGNGSQIKYSDLNVNLLKNIYNFISNKIENNAGFL